jgi:hypothetical protein
MINYNGVDEKKEKNNKPSQCVPFETVPKLHEIDVESEIKILSEVF